jgi:hypothetical protein
MAPNGEEEDSEDYSIKKILFFSIFLENIRFWGKNVFFRGKNLIF